MRQGGQISCVYFMCQRGTCALDLKDKPPFGRRQRSPVRCRQWSCQYFSPSHVTEQTCIVPTVGPPESGQRSLTLHGCVAVWPVGKDHIHILKLHPLEGAL